MAHDPFDLAAQANAKKARDDQTRLDRKTEADDLKWLMGSRRGRRIVWRLIERTGFFQSSFTGNSETFFREGARAVGLRLVTLINSVCPELYAPMVQEQSEHDRSNNDGTN